MKYKLYKNFEELCETVVDNLEENKVIGWFKARVNLDLEHWAIGQY